MAYIPLTPGKVSGNLGERSGGGPWFLLLILLNLALDAVPHGTPKCIPKDNGHSMPIVPLRLDDPPSIDPSE